MAQGKGDRPKGVNPSKDEFTSDCIWATRIHAESNYKLLQKLRHVDHLRTYSLEPRYSSARDVTTDILMFVTAPINCHSNMRWHYDHTRCF